MPYSDKEKQKAYKRQYYLDNKEKIKEKKKQYDKKYKEENKEKTREYNLTYWELPEYKKLISIKNWKRQGIKSDNYDKLYDYYLSVETCDLCDINIQGKQKKCLDHCHRTGYMRNVVCQKCNLQKPKYERLYTEVLLDLHRYFSRL